MVKVVWFCQCEESNVIEGLVNNPINPFTWNSINEVSNNREEEYIIASHKWETSENNGKRYLPDIWFKVDRSALDRKCWTEISEEELPR